MNEYLIKISGVEYGLENITVYGEYREHCVKSCHFGSILGNQAHTLTKTG